MNNLKRLAVFTPGMPRFRSILVLLGILVSFWSFQGCDSSSKREKPRTNFEIDDSPTSADPSHAEGGEHLDHDSETSVVDSDGWKNDLDAPDAVARLIAYASTLRARRPQVSKQQQMVDRVSLIEIGAELEKRELDSSQKAAAFQMKSQSLLELVSAGNEEYRDQLIGTFESYRTDSDKTLALSAEFLELNLAISDYFNDGANDFSKAQEVFLKISRAHPNDAGVVQSVTGLLSELIARGHSTPVAAVMQELADFYGQSDDVHSKRIAGIFEDRIFLVESNFAQIATDASKGVDGAMEKYQETIRSLARHRGSGEFYRETISGVHMLEKQSLFRDARELYGLLQQTYASHPDPSVVEQVKMDVERGTRRLDLIGNPIELVGNTLEGKSFDQSRLKDKVVAVFFWSSKFPRSARVMQTLVPVYHLYRNDGLEVVAICVDEDVNRAIGIFGGKTPPWPTLFQNDEQVFRQMLDDLGIQMLPYTILIDKQGNVADVFVPTQDLNKQILKLLELDDDRVPANLASPPGN